MTEEKTTILTALLGVQREIPSLKLGKDATNPHFKSRYLTLDKLMSEVLPLLNRHGLVWVTCPIEAPNGPALEYQLMLASSPEQDVISGVMPLLLDKENSQGFGSAITYARRYSLSAVLGITPDEDDDGTKASQQRARPAPADPEGVLEPERIAVMMDKIKKSEKDLDTVLREAGIERVADTTEEQAKRVWELIR